MRVSDAFPSKWLKVEDLNKKEVLVTIDRVVMEDVGSGDQAEEKPVLYFKNGKKGLPLNKTNAMTIGMVLEEEEMNLWSGHRVILYPAMTQFQGKPTPCIRVRQAPEPKNVGAAAKNNPFVQEPPPQNDPSEIFSEDPDGEEPPF